MTFIRHLSIAFKEVPCSGHGNDLCPCLVYPLFYAYTYFAVQPYGCVPYSDASYKVPDATMYPSSPSHSTRLAWVVRRQLEPVYMPVILIAAYPTVRTTVSVNRLLGTPRLMKCFTFKYLCPAGSSFMMAATEAG